VSRFNRESLSVVLGRDAIELRALDRRTRVWDVRAQQAGGLGNPGSGSPGSADSPVQEALIGLLAQHTCAGAALATVIGDECARYFVVEPPANARSVSDLRLAAKLRMEALYGDAAADWAIDADWRASRRFLACAVPSAALAAVTAAIVATKLRGAGVTTEFVASWSRHRRQMRDRQGWVVHAGRQATVLAACVDGALSAVSTVAAALPLSAEDVKTEIERCVLRWNLPAPATVYLLGPGSVAWSEQRIGEATVVPIPPAAGVMAARKAA
jgi:hypothetical protein